LIMISAIGILCAKAIPVTASSLSDVNHPPANIPSQLPAGIEDPLLIEAWIVLYNMTQPIPLWNGSSVTGRQLAQNVLDQNIQVTWSTPDICPRSCTIRKICTDGQCPAGTPPPRVYITSEYKEDSPDRSQQILSTLAHELYHSIAPFGNVKVTQIEEMMAFYVSSQIVPNSWADFKGYDPLNPICLRIWNRDNNLKYTELDPYPDSLINQAKLNESSCYTRTDNQKDLVMIAIPNTP